MKKSHKIQNISFSEDKMVIKVDGKKYIFKIGDISQKLEGASQVEREKYEISPSGYGIHWPTLDEDLSIDGLLGIKHKPSRDQESVSA
jgi:hypothetical protein